MDDVRPDVASRNLVGGIFTVSRMDFLVESSGEWESGRETVTVGIVRIEVDADVAAPARRVRDIVGLADELGVLSVKDDRWRRDRRVAISQSGNRVQVK